MKDLEAQTGVSREAIHFYLREGLLPEPTRPKKNVALYSDEHVVRIRAIKQLQQDQSLSLVAIKDILDDFDYDAFTFDDDLSTFEMAVQTRVNGELPQRDRTLKEISELTGLSAGFLNEACRLGVVTPKETSRGVTLDFRDVGILELWGKLLQRGFGDKPGYDVAYLKRFADAIKVIAEAEVENFLSVFGHLPTDNAADLAAEGIAITNGIMTRMRTQALMRALHDRVGDG